MTESVPELGAEDIERLVQREFPNDVDDVRRRLNEYGGERWQKEPFRVRAAVLYLAKSDLRALESLLEAASIDYRDVLLWAEYPNNDQGKEARSADSARYHKWLQGE